jgi:hypothetical protein
VTNDRCGNCRYWVLPGGESGGECRRFPPAMLVWPETEATVAYAERSWPETAEDDWCGEHSPVRPVRKSMADG